MNLNGTNYFITLENAEFRLVDPTEYLKYGSGYLYEFESHLIERNFDIVNYPTYYSFIKQKKSRLISSVFTSSYPLKLLEICLSGYNCSEISKCRENNEYYNPSTNSCVSNCTEIGRMPFLDEACITELECKKTPLFYRNGICTQKCPNIKDYVDKECLETIEDCKNKIGDYYFDSKIITCTNECIGSWYKDHTTKSCVQQCENKEDEIGKYCYSELKIKDWKNVKRSGKIIQFEVEFENDHENFTNPLMKEFIKDLSFKIKNDDKEEEFLDKRIVEKVSGSTFKISFDSGRYKALTFKIKLDRDSLIMFKEGENTYETKFKLADENLEFSYTVNRSYTDIILIISLIIIIIIIIVVYIVYRKK